MKLIAAAAVAALLAACTAGATTPSEQPLPTVSASASMGLPSASAAAMSCTDAFAAVDLSTVDATTDLSTLADQLDETVASCGSVNEWTAALQTAAPEVNVTSALALLQARCAENAELQGTALCSQVGP